MTMDKQEIKVRLDKIVAASEQVVSVGTHAMHNAQQLLGIQRMAGEIWALVSAEGEDEFSGG